MVIWSLGYEDEDNVKAISKLGRVGVPSKPATVEINVGYTETQTRL